ncbi:MAG: hypothetical protein JJ902_12245 [Roseibium sp.]|nr:hypothetical protein [Roseibium sp.]
MKNLGIAVCAASSIALGSLIPFHSANAFDPTGNPVADAFLALLEAEDGKVDSYGELTESGGRVEIMDIKVSSDASDEDVQVSIAVTVLNNGTVDDDGRLTLDGMELKTMTMSSDSGGLDIGSFMATDLVLPSVAEVAASDELPLSGPSYRTLEILDVKVTGDEGNTVELDRVFSAIDGMSGDLPTDIRFSLDNVRLDAASLDSETEKTLTDLGYDKVAVNVAGAGKWDPDTATADISELIVSGDDVGTIKLQLTLGGITRDLVDQLNTTGGSPEDAFGLVQGVTIGGLMIDLQNASLVERVLDMQANDAGMDRAAYVQQLSATLPLMLAVLQNQAFQDKVAGALTAFLNDPISLNVSAAPQNPVPMAQIMGTVMMAPQALPDILGIEIIANGAN